MGICNARKQATLSPREEVFTIDFSQSTSLLCSSYIIYVYQSCNDACGIACFHDWETGTEPEQATFRPGNGR